MMRIEVPLVLYPEEDVEADKEAETEVVANPRVGGEETEMRKSKAEAENLTEVVAANNQNVTETVSRKPLKSICCGPPICLNSAFFRLLRWDLNPQQVLQRMPFNLHFS